MAEGELVNEMFSHIASRYDCANHLLSMGIDYYWRYKLVSFVKEMKPRTVVDLATGSGDVAFALQKSLGEEVRVIGLDFCRPMLEQAQAKKAKYPYGKNIVFDFGDCMALPLEDHSIDVITIAFGFRNLQDRKKSLKEMYRILKPGGAIFILEFTQPACYFRPFYFFYLKKILPRLASMITGCKDAYEYLGDSIKQFPNKEDLRMEIRDAGFKNVQAYTMTGSIVAIHKGMV